MTKKTKTENVLVQEKINIKKSWPRPMADAVYAKILRWSNSYEAGQWTDVRSKPSINDPALKETVLIRATHKIGFKYQELKWISDQLILEAFKKSETTTQSKIFEMALVRHIDQQTAGRVPFGGEWAQEFTITKDEVNYIRMLLACIKIGTLTPGDRYRQGKDIESSSW